MSATYQPTGLRPVGRVGNVPYEGGTTEYPVTTNNTVAIAAGDPVALVGGSIVPLTANPVSGTLSANTPIGVVVGFEFNDPTLGFRTSQMLDANSVSSLNRKNIVALVADDPNAVFVVQADNTIAAADLGAAIGLGGFNVDDTTLKVSRVFADHTTVSTSSSSTAALKIVGFAKEINNAAGDAFTKLLVRWNAGVHYNTFAGAH